MLDLIPVRELFKKNYAGIYFNYIDTMEVGYFLITNLCIGFIIFIMFKLYIHVCNNMKCMQGPNENQFRLFGLTLGK